MAESISLICFSYSLGCPKNTLSSTSETLFFHPPPLFFANFAQGANFGCFFDLPFEPEEMGPSHFFFSPTTLGCPKNILSSKSETLFSPAPLHPRKKTGVQLFFRGRTHRKNEHFGPGRGNGKELEPDIWENVHPIGAKFPQNMGLHFKQ